MWIWVVLFEQRRVLALAQAIYTYKGVEDRRIRTWNDGQYLPSYWPLDITEAGRRSTPRKTLTSLRAQQNQGIGACTLTRFSVRTIHAKQSSAKQGD